MLPVKYVVRRVMTIGSATAAESVVVLLANVMMKI